MTKRDLKRLQYAVLALALLLVLAERWLNQPEETTVSSVAVADCVRAEGEQPEEDYRICYEIPALQEQRTEQIIHHIGYTVSYNKDWHLPNWVAYELTHEETIGEENRTDKFLPDPLVEGDPVVTSDYKGSGYDRGHMAPAADMRWSAEAMKESFYMTNICPQNHNNNAGDWKQLEELGRDWAQRYGTIYIACGPILGKNPATIGTTRKILVPESFYKVFLRMDEHGSWHSIGFVMQNIAQSKPLMSYMMSVNDIEALTHIDFFPALPDDLEEVVEDQFDTKSWVIK